MVYAIERYAVKVSNGHRSHMADGHLGLGSNVQLGLVDFKVCYWPQNFKIHKTKLDI